MKKKYSVLVVDDAFFIRNLIKRAIGNKPSSDYPYEFEIAGEGLDGEEGLLLYKALKPDVVTVDVNMGSLGGVAFIKKIRAFDKNAQVIVISSSLDNNLKAEISKLGCYYIQKPFQEAYLWTKLDTIAEYLMSKPKKIVQPKKAEQPKLVESEASKKKVSDLKMETSTTKKETLNDEVIPNTKVTTETKVEIKKEVNKNKGNKQQNKPQNSNQKKNQPNKNKQKKKHLLDDEDSLVGTIPQEVLKGYKNKPTQQSNNKNKQNQNKSNKQSKLNNQNNKPKTKEVKKPVDDFVVEDGLSINAMRNRIKQNHKKNEVKKPVEEIKKPVINTPIVEVVEEVTIAVSKKESVTEVTKPKVTAETVPIEESVDLEEVIEIPTIVEEAPVEVVDETLDIVNDKYLETSINEEVLDIIEEDTLEIEEDTFTVDEEEITIEDDSELIIIDETSDDEILDIAEDEVLEIIDDESLNIVDEEEITIEDETLDIIDEDYDDGELILAYEEDIPTSLDVQKNILEDELEEDLMLTENISYEGHYEDEELEIVEDDEIELVEEPSLESEKELSIEDSLLEDVSYNMDELLTNPVEDKEDLKTSILSEIAKDLKKEFDKPIEEKKSALSVEEELGIEDNDEIIFEDEDDFDFDDFKDIEFSLDTDSYTEELPTKNENMYYQTDNAPKTELNIYNDNYNTVNNEIKHTSSGGIKIAPPKDSRLREIYSAKMEKDYNIVFDEGKEKEPTEPVKKDGLFSKLFNKKKRNK